MIVYTLNAHLSCFDGTDRDSGRKVVQVAVSKYQSRLEELKKVMEAKDYRDEATRIKNLSWRDRPHRPTLIVITSFGEVTLPVFLDDYYGDGYVSYYEIDEINYLDESEFV